MITLRCKKHPTYKAVYKPTADCQDCRKLWKIAQQNVQLVTATRKPRTRVETRTVTVSAPSFIDDALMRAAYANQLR